MTAQERAERLVEAWRDSLWTPTTDEKAAAIAELIEAAVAEEREACALICDSEKSAQIRERGK